LEDRAVLAVHGQESDSFLFGGADENLTRHHQRLFIGKGDFFSRSYRRKRRQQSRSADNSGHNDIDFMRRRNCGRSPFSVEHFNSIFSEQFAQAWYVLLILNGNTSGCKLPNLRHEPLEIFSRHQPVYFETLGELADEIEGTHSDRTGRAKKSYRFHG
jgi:hypothetical protein